MCFSVGITVNKKSYTPEAYAYERYLKSKMIDVFIAEPQELDPTLDIHIYFMGLRPAWKKKGAWKEVHEYHSLSVPPFSKIKDRLKSHINLIPDGRIFLNNQVHDGLAIDHIIPFIYRDMGVDSSLFQTPNKNPFYDIVYSGTTKSRPGLWEEIVRLSEIGLKVLVIGSVEKEARDFFKKNKNIFFSGRVGRENLPELYRNCKMGLNYTPDIYPFNIQTSTKTLEYLASGLLVISNRYQWTSRYFKKNPKSVVWLDQVHSAEDFYGYLDRPLDLIKPPSWDSVLESSGFFDFLKGLYHEF